MHSKCLMLLISQKMLFFTPTNMKTNKSGRGPGSSWCSPRAAFTAWETLRRVQAGTQKPLALPLSLQHLETELKSAECLNPNSSLRQRPAVHGCLWRTLLLMFASYLWATVQAFALQLSQALDLRESKILLSKQFFSQKEHFGAGVKSAKQSEWLMPCCLWKRPEQGREKPESCPAQKKCYHKPAG